MHFCCCCFNFRACNAKFYLRCGMQLKPSAATPTLAKRNCGKGEQLVTSAPSLIYGAPKKAWGWFVGSS